VPVLGRPRRAGGADGLVLRAGRAGLSLPDTEVGKLVHDAGTGLRQFVRGANGDVRRRGDVAGAGGGLPSVRERHQGSLLPG
jgi:hypothetical protein